MSYHDDGVKIIQHLHKNSGRFFYPSDIAHELNMDEMIVEATCAKLKAYGFLSSHMTLSSATPAYAANATSLAFLVGDEPVKPAQSVSIGAIHANNAVVGNVETMDNSVHHGLTPDDLKRIASVLTPQELSELKNAISELRSLKADCQSGPVVKKRFGDFVSELPKHMTALVNVATLVLKIIECSNGVG